MPPVRERLGRMRPAPAAHLARAAWVHRDHDDASFFRFARQNQDELAPTGILNTLVQAALRRRPVGRVRPIIVLDGRGPLGHVVDGQGFNGHGAYTEAMKDTQSRSRTRQMPLRLNDEERAKLEAIAAMWGLSLSATIRRLIREKWISGEREATAAKASEGCLSQG